MLDHIRPEPEQKRLLLLDQRLLPQREEYFICRSTSEVVYALREMVVRGAPAIGVSAAWGCWIAALELEREGIGRSRHWKTLLREALQKITEARPTAINLGWAVKRMLRIWEDEKPTRLEALADLWLKEAAAIHLEDVEQNRRIGTLGAGLIADGDTVMTHCNAGALATGGYGTALGVIYAAREAGKRIKVIVNETRPLLQGARLSAYELNRAGIEARIACDSACALLMSKGLVQKVFTGADRIAANGDAANKIGTYGVALLAREFKIPFYMAAPSSSFDLACPDGNAIPIEERPAQEVTHLSGARIAPEEVSAYNFAFDVTPADLITGIITERGLFTPPYAQSLRKLKK